MMELTWSAPTGPSGSARIVETWLGPASAHESSVPVDARVTGLTRITAAKWTNLDALCALPWWGPRELLVLRDSSLEHLGHFSTDGTAAAPFALLGSLTQAWRRLTDQLPPLPWPAIRVYEGAWEWPRALALPGVILVSKTFPKESARSTLLYLVHELIHQWLGGVLAPPTNPEAHSQMEAIVDACTRFHVESVFPTTRSAFAALYRRYAAITDLADHADRTEAAYRLLEDGGWLRLTADIDAAVEKLRNGHRDVFDPACIQAGVTR